MRYNARSASAEIRSIVQSVANLEAVTTAASRQAVERALQNVEVCNPFTGTNPKGLPCPCFEVEVAGITAVIEDIGDMAKDHADLSLLTPDVKSEKYRSLVDDLSEKLEEWIRFEVEMLDDRLRAYPYREIVLVSGWPMNVIMAQGVDLRTAELSLLASQGLLDQKLVESLIWDSRQDFVAYSVPWGVEFNAGDEALVMEHCWGRQEESYALVNEEAESALDEEEGQAV
jgi:hypothetical protein